MSGHTHTHIHTRQLRCAHAHRGLIIIIISVWFLLSVLPSIRICPYFYGIRLSDTGVRNVSWEYGN